MSTIAHVSATDRIRTSKLVFWLLVVLTAGYWAFGRSFAYVGLYPLFIGEIIIVIGLLAILRYGTIPVPRNTMFWVFLIMLVIVIGQAFHSILVLNQPMIEVLRGTAMIYYGLYAYITFVLIERARRPGDMIEQALTDVLPRIAPWVLVGSTVTIIGALYFVDLLPRFPRTEVPILWYKPTDAVLPLAVMLVAWMRGYLKTRYAVWAAGLVLFAAARSRSAMLGVAFAFLLMLWRPTKRMVIALIAVTVIFVFLLISDISISMGYREISARQLMANAISLVDSAEAGEIDASTAQNKSWRLDWWTAIFNDAVDNARILVGTGWGDNLANRYGFQIFAESEGVNVLRNPHNAFINVLGRGGWIVAGIWTLFHVILFNGLWQAARNKLHSTVERDVAWICLIYLTVSMINGSTDVYLESPQNAIPHWIVIGVAWSLIYRKQDQETVSEPEPTPQRRSRPLAQPATGLHRQAGD